MQIVNHNFKISIMNISIGTQRRTLRPPRSAPDFSRFFVLQSLYIIVVSILSGECLTFFIIQRMNFYTHLCAYLRPLFNDAFCTFSHYIYFQIMLTNNCFVDLIIIDIIFFSLMKSRLIAF